MLLFKFYLVTEYQMEVNMQSFLHVDNGNNSLVFSVIIILKV